MFCGPTLRLTITTLHPVTTRRQCTLYKKETHNVPYSPSQSGTSHTTHTTGGFTPWRALKHIVSCAQECTAAKLVQSNTERANRKQEGKGAVRNREGQPEPVQGADGGGSSVGACARACSHAREDGYGIIEFVISNSDRQTDTWWGAAKADCLRRLYVHVYGPHVRTI